MSTAPDKDKKDPTPESDANAPPTLSLKTQFKAWWEGYDLSGLKRRNKGDSDADANDGSAGGQKKQAGLNRHGKPLWTATRIEVAEKIWGTGFVQPGGADLIDTLTKPLGLNPAMTVLELGCGLGGATRAMASLKGCYVTGLESSPYLVEQGMQRSTKAGLAKQAPVQLFDPENLSFGKRVDAVFAKDAFFTIQNKTQLFDTIESILKPRGHFLITDYIVEPDARNSKALQSWSNREPLEPQLWTLDGALNAFAQCNFDLRVHEDITQSHRHQIVLAIRALTEHLEKHQLDNDTKVNVIDEVETWAQRVAALGSGLKCYRFYALKPPEA
ncbi:MAG: methyltransferase domain-containing protein [Rhodospirillaceae bacterium]